MRQHIRFQLYIIITAILFGACVQQNKNQEPAPQERMDGMALAIQQEFRMTRDPQLNIVPKERLVSARAYMETLQSTGARINALAWQERGPNNIGGRTRAIM